MSLRLCRTHLDALTADAGLECIGRAASDDFAVIYHRYGVGQRVCLFEVLRCPAAGSRLLDQVANHVPHAEAAARVEASRRFVEEQHVGAR